MAGCFLIYKVICIFRARGAQGPTGWWERKKNLKANHWTSRKLPPADIWKN